MKYETGINLTQGYLTLPKTMHSLLRPNHIKNPELVLLNESLSETLNIEPSFLKSDQGVRFLTGQTDEFGVLSAQAYAGHQYGHFTILGDGRAMLLGEQNTQNGILYDLQLKGSGKTPYSRRGDGKATLYSMLREYLISEAMYALGIPTTRMLSVIKTNEFVQREDLKQGGILCRVASSHIRVGTFEYANAAGGKPVVKELADYAIQRHFPELVSSKSKYKDFLQSVIKKQASLIARWQSIGFVHGVMNTDNMTISGETIDYGPCAFLDDYQPHISFSSIDQNGRYAYNQQPFIGSWNLSKFAETLLPLLSDDIQEAVVMANQELEQYRDYFTTAYYSLMAKKIGIIEPTEDEKVLIDELLQMMEQHPSDYTNTFRLLTLDEYSKLPFFKTDEWVQWFQRWTKSLGVRQMEVHKRMELMEHNNPVVIPRNVLVEEALEKASRYDDYSLFNEVLEQLMDPYNYRKTYDDKFIEPIPSTQRFVTYCGT